jgi:hypothetical protein
MAEPASVLPHVAATMAYGIDPSCRSGVVGISAARNHLVALFMLDLAVCYILKACSGSLAGITDAIERGIITPTTEARLEALEAEQAEVR